MAATLFEKICSGEIPADIVYQDEQCVCFRDISPQAPEHLLLVPRKPIPDGLHGPSTWMKAASA